MGLVEGFGDEVLVSLVLLALLTLALLAWMSTGVRDRPLISIIVVDGQNFQRILHRISNLTLRPISIHRHAAGNSSVGRSIETSGGNGGETTTDSEVTVSHQGGVEIPSDNTGPPVTASENTVPVSETNTDGSRDSANSTETPVLVNPGGNSAVDNNSSNLPAAEVGKDSQSPEVSTPTQAEENSMPEASTSQANSSQTSPQAEPDDEGQIRIRLKYLDDRQRLVHAKPEDTVGDFKRKHFGRELGENLMVRCIYNGQELRQDSNTLQAYNVEDNGVIHCLLSTRPAHATPRAPRGLLPEDWDLGFLMFPLFGVILALTWYFRVTYRTYFNAMSTFSLLGITFLYFIALLASLYNHDEEDIVD